MYSEVNRFYFQTFLNKGMNLNELSIDSYLHTTLVKKCSVLSL